MIHNVDPQLSQWDVGRSVEVSGTNATHVHFANQGDSKAVKIEIKEGSAKIPDYLLQTGKTLIAYAYLDGVTLESKSFAVRKRPRPEDYVYEDDQRNYIYEWISSAEKAAAAANEAADRANQAAKSWVMMGKVSGESIAIDDAIKQSFAGFRIFGKTTQDGVPTPEAPVELVSVGDGGSITVNVAGKNDANSMTIATPNGLPGIPVDTGGNYTDANGRQWVCDEIDLARGVFVQRIIKITPTTASANGTYEGQTPFGKIVAELPLVVGSNLLCTHLQLTNSAIYSSNQLVGAYVFGEKEIRFRLSATNTADDVTDFIKKNVVAFLCILATPIETPLSAEELATYAALHTYRDLTTVSNDASAHMEVEYSMDAKKYIDSLMAGTIHSATVE